MLVLLVTLLTNGEALTGKTARHNGDVAVITAAMSRATVHEASSSSSRPVSERQHVQPGERGVRVRSYST
jgi:hypothetical protein